MNCKTYTTTINNHKYGYTQLPATKSLKLKYELAGILGGALLELSEARGKPTEVQMKMFGAVAQKVFANSDPDKLVDLITRIFTPCFRDEERVNIDEHYTNNTSEMYQAIAWILKTEYASFLDDMQVVEMKEKVPE